jgi:hypothetical protein
MNWDAIGAIGEIIGAIAVVSTLFYLAVQIRQSAKVAREQAHYHMLQNQVSTMDRWATDREYVKTTFGKGLTEDRIDEIQHEMVAQSVLLKWNWEFLRAQEGLYEDKDMPVAGYRWLYTTAGFGKHWGSIRERVDSDFAKFMEEEVITDEGNT